MCSRYKRKGNSSLGLDPRKQQVSWEESESNKKRKGANKKAARYYSAVSRQMLTSEAPISMFPTTPESSSATGSASFLPLTDEENIKREPGRRSSHNRRCTIKQSTWYLSNLASYFSVNVPFNPGAVVQLTAANPLGVYDSSTALWLQGKGQQAQTEQQNPEIKSEPSATLLTGRTEEFNRQLREQPADTQLWMKFIKFQVKRLWLHVMHFTGTLTVSA